MNRSKLMTTLATTLLAPAGLVLFSASGAMAASGTCSTQIGNGYTVSICDGNSHFNQTDIASGYFPYEGKAYGPCVQTGNESRATFSMSANVVRIYTVEC
jgi:hypothetical protein